MKDDKVYLKHILDSIHKIEGYTEGVDEIVFLSEPEMVNDAVVRQLEIIGEASRNISESFRNSHQEIPWRSIIGMRSKIIHEYLEVDYVEVWNVVQYDLPKLKEKVTNLISKF